MLTVPVPLDPRLVALQYRVNDNRAAQAHGLAFSSKRYTELINNVSLEGDAVLRHWSIYRGSNKSLGGGWCNKRALTTQTQINSSRIKQIWGEEEEETFTKQTNLDTVS